MTNRREFLLATMLAPLIRPIAAMFPAQPNEVSFTVSGLSGRGEWRVLWSHWNGQYWEPMLLDNLEPPTHDGYRCADWIQEPRGDT